MTELSEDDADAGMQSRASRRGLEASGTVAAIGANVTQWQVGDQVCALTPGGAYAEYCVAPAAHCLPLPGGFDLEKAGAIPENFFTVWTNVIERGRLAQGETIMIHGGSGGIGYSAIQVAKSWGATDRYELRWKLSFPVRLPLFRGRRSPFAPTGPK